MSSENEYLNDDQLIDAIEDILGYISGEGSEVLPEKMKQNIFSIIAATKRNKNLTSYEIGTAGKGGVMKIYFDPDDIDGSIERVTKAYVIRQHMQTLHTSEDIKPK